MTSPGAIRVTTPWAWSVPPEAWEEQTKAIAKSRAARDMERPPLNATGIYSGLGSRRDPCPVIAGCRPSGWKRVFLPSVARDCVYAWRSMSPRTLVLALWVVVSAPRAGAQSPLDSLLLRLRNPQTRNDSILARSRDSIIHAFAVESLAAFTLGNFDVFLARLDTVRKLEPYRLATDTTITPQEAGRALHQLLMWSDSGRGAALQPAPDSASNLWFPELPAEGPLGVPPKDWCTRLLPMAASFTPAQVEFLESITPQPRDTLLLRFAGARHVDILGGRWTFSGAGDRAMFWLLLPLARVSGFRNAIRVSCARAALQLHGGRIREAEVTLRVTLNGTLLLAEEGTEIPELAMGLVTARMVGSALASFYEVTGRPGEAAALRDALHHPDHTTLPERLRGPATTVKDVLEALPDAARQPGVLAAFLWDRLRWAQTIQVQAHCVGEDALGSRHADWLNRVRPGLVHQPSDSAYFEWITRKPAARGAECYDPSLRH